MEKSKAAKALDVLRSLIGIELATEINLTDYEAKDGSKISTGEDGKVQGDVADGEYELADGSTLIVKDGVASKKEAEKTEDVKEETEKAADETAEVSDEAKESTSDDALKSSIDALTGAIQQLISGMGLKEEELKEAKTKLAVAEIKLEEADKRPIDNKPGVGQGLTTLNDDTKLTKAQRALAAARANKG